MQVFDATNDPAFKRYFVLASLCCDLDIGWKQAVAPTESPATSIVERTVVTVVNPDFNSPSVTKAFKHEVI